MCSNLKDMARRDAALRFASGVRPPLADFFFQSDLQLKKATRYYDKMAINTKSARSISLQPSLKTIKPRTGRFEYNCMDCIKANKKYIKLSQV